MQQQLHDRDTDFEELQQQWNLQNFKFCLLVDMVSGDTLAFAIHDCLGTGLGRPKPACHGSALHVSHALLLQWAMRLLDNEELAQQVEASLKPGTGRITKVSK